MNYETKEQRINREFWETFEPTKTYAECEKEDTHSYRPRGRTYIKCVNCGNAINRGQW